MYFLQISQSLDTCKYIVNVFQIYIPKQINFKYSHSTYREIIHES